MWRRSLPLAALLLAACTDLTTPPRTPTRIEFEADTVVLTAGDAAELTVTLLDQDGRPFDPIPAWAAPRWSSSAPAIVDADETRLHARAPGQAQATVRVAGLSRTAVVRVNPTALRLSVERVVLAQERNDTDALWPGRDAVVRVHLTGDQVNFFRPQVDLALYVGDARVHGVALRRERASVPLEGAPQDTADAWTGVIPGAFVQQGLSLVVEADPERAIAHAPGSRPRFPASGALAVAVREPSLRLAIEGVYLTQGVQRFDGTVPLVAGRDALLRVFLTADAANDQRPHVDVTIHHGGGAVAFSGRARQAADAIPRSVHEGDLQRSWNVRVPGAALRPGATLVVDADPERTIPLKPGSRPRYPAEGRAQLDVREVPPFRGRLVPVRQTAFGTTGDVGATNLEHFRRALVGVFPLAAHDLDVRAPYTTDARLDDNEGWYRLIQEIRALRIVDASDRYYYGVAVHPGGSSIGGLGYLGWPVAIGYDQMPHAAWTYAHEVGHNFSREHAPCGLAPGSDPRFPHSGGGIGAWGHDLFGGEPKDPTLEKDLMGYCSPRWISDYTYEAVLAFRERNDWTPRAGTAARAAAAHAAAEPALLLWGGVRNGGLELEPAFVLETTPSLPARDGPYRIEGYDAAGARLFAIGFEAQALDHLAGSRGFAFAVPARLAQPERLARLELSGPEGRVSRSTSTGPAIAPSLRLERRAGAAALTWPGDRYPMALVRDARTGQVLSFARGGRARLTDDGAQLDILLSDGVRTIRPALHPR